MLEQNILLTFSSLIISNICLVEVSANSRVSKFPPYHSSAFFFFTDLALNSGSQSCWKRRRGIHKPFQESWEHEMSYNVLVC